ncbi:uncharacterized protein LOC123540065 [Mercenaria mercenaria]|uniref:uncharacterized protein LOC123540065 n=1 Tax=Mercenaria mercenaria TaxID=6596 RepID=UPI00234E5D9B|nr:uncharacterized protein LOC123540065 [Mercenaria mercenaria]
MATPLYDPKLSGTKFKNWIKAGLGVLLTKEGIEPFVYDEIEQFQQKCLSDICNNNGLPAGTTCSSCCTENVIVCPTNRICNARRGNCNFHRNSATQYLPSGCPNKICHNFKNEIQRSHRYYGPSYKNTDATQWCSNPWEVAKCFMPPDGYKDATKSADTDFNGIISVILNYGAFQSKISNKNNIFEQGREVGKAVRHCPQLEMEDTDLQHCFSVLQNLLSDPAYLSANTDAQNAKTKLLQLQNDTLVIGKDDVRKVLDDIGKAVQDEIRTAKEDYMKNAKMKTLQIIKLTKTFVSTIDKHGKASISQLEKAYNSAMDEIEKQAKKSIEDVQAEGKKQKEDIIAEGHTVKRQLVDVADQEVKRLKTEATAGINTMEAEANTQVKTIASEGEKQKEDIVAEGHTVKGKLVDVADQEVIRLKTEATAGINTMEAEANTQVKTIASEGEKQKEDIVAEGHTVKGKLVDVADQEVKRLKTEATAGINTMEAEANTHAKAIASKAGEVAEQIAGARDEVLEQIEKTKTESKEDIYNKLKNELKDDLATFYKTRYSTIPLSPLVEGHDTPLVDFYILPEMNFIEKQDKKPAGKETKTPVKSLSEVFQSENSCEMYLTADAGFGKTAFSKYLAVTWCQAHRPEMKYKKYFSEDSITAMRDFEFLFLVLLRDSSDDCSIDDLIMNQIIQNLAQSSKMTLESIQGILRRERFLIILDALDEWVHPEKKCKKEPKTIPHRNAREKCVILTTTRPWKLGVLNLKNSEIDKKVELVKLTSESAQTLEERAISKIKNLDVAEAKILAEQLNKKIKENKLEEMESVPLLSMYLISLWCEDIPLGQSKCGLYASIIELLLSRTLSKHPEMEPTGEPSQSDIPQCFSEHEHCNQYCTYLKALGKLAYETLFSETKENTLVFYKAVAEKYLSPNDLKLSLNSGILTQSTEKTLLKQITKVSFSHKTIQEFLCALYISCQNENGVKKIVLNKCKSLQSILDMSTVLVFINGMVNTEIISSISQEFLSVISEDKTTSEYRSTTAEYCEPLKDIQDMYISCMKENTSDKELKLFCQDFFFKNIYCGKVENAQLRVLLDKSPKCVNVRSFDETHGSWSREMLETLQNNSLLQAIFIDEFKMSHDVLNDFLNYIINRKTMTEIELWDLDCTEHGDSCTFSLDFSQHSDLRVLQLLEIPEVSQLKVNSQVKHVELWCINLGEMSLPPEMANIESVYLERVNMSASTLRDLVKVVEKFSHKVTVTIEWCEIEPETEFEHVKQYIHLSQNFRVTEDERREDEMWEDERWVFEFETKVES